MARKKKSFLRKLIGKTIFAGFLATSASIGTYFASDNVKYETDAFIREKVSEYKKESIPRIKVGLAKAEDCEASEIKDAYISVTGKPLICYKVTLPIDKIKNYSVSIDGKVINLGKVERKDGNLELILKTQTGEKSKAFPERSKIDFFYLTQIKTKSMANGLHTIKLEADYGNETKTAKAYFKLK